MIDRLEELHRELAAQARMQGDLLARDDLEALEDTWRRRRRVCREMSALYRRLAPELADWESTLAGLKPDQSQRARQAVAAITALVGEVQARDQKTARALEEMKEACHQALAHLRQGAKLVRAYRPLPRRSGGPCQLSRSG